jgi:hypothetical protein
MRAMEMGKGIRQAFSKINEVIASYGAEAYEWGISYADGDCIHPVASVLVSDGGAVRVDTVSIELFPMWDDDRGCDVLDEYGSPIFPDYTDDEVELAVMAGFTYYIDDLMDREPDDGKMGQLVRMREQVVLAMVA